MQRIRPLQPARRGSGIAWKTAILTAKSVAVLVQRCYTTLEWRLHELQRVTSDEMGFAPWPQKGGG